MKIFAIVIVLIGLASARVIDTKGKIVDVAGEVCFENYGCFDTSAPWTSLLRPFSSLPKPPHEVGTRFLLFTRGDYENEQYGYELMPGKDAILKFSDFKPERKTYFLVHGFTDSHRAEWMWNTKDELLKNEDANIIAVDWAPGAKSPYLQAIANARLVGAQIARMVSYLEQKGEMKIDDVHIVSHSLGGHVAGYAGDRLMGRVPRITAIDPMELYFGGTDPIVRLDQGDAKFVEVIHSNAHILTNLGLGINDAIGHVDLYPNGGVKQPGCKDTLGNLITSIIDLITLDFEGAISTWACSHVRAAHFFAESIAESDSCPFVSFQCKSYDDYQKGKCYQTCNEAGKCTPLGYNAKKHSGTGIYYLQTTDGSLNGTYCKQIVQIQVPVSITQTQTTGSLKVAFKGSDGTLSEKFTIVDNSKISPGQLLQTWVEVPNSILRRPDQPFRLVLQYKRGGLLPITQPKTLALDGLVLNIIKPDLTTLQTTFQSVTLDYGKDVTISQ